MKKPLAVLTIVILLIQSLSLAWAWEIERPSEDIDLKEREESFVHDFVFLSKFYIIAVTKYKMFLV